MKFVTLSQQNDFSFIALNAVLTFCHVLPHIKKERRLVHTRRGSKLLLERLHIVHVEVKLYSTDVLREELG